MDITLNLATQSYQQVQRFHARWKLIIAGVAFIAVGLLCGSVASFLSWHAAKKQIGQLRQQIEEREREKKGIESFLDRPESRQIYARSEFLNSVIARKAFSWTEVFADMEQVIPAHVHVTSIHPNVNDDGQIELYLSLAGAKREAAIELVRRLERSSHFTQVQIHDERFQTNHSGQTASDTVQYSVTAIYIPKFARKPAENAAPQIGSVPEVASSQPEAPRETAYARH